MGGDFDDLTTHVLDRAPTMQAAAIELVVVDGPDRGARHRLKIGTSRVGTAASCQVRLADPTVSRLHCEISLGREGARLVDAGSTNGTFVDGVRVRDADLEAHSTVRIGKTMLRIEIGDRPAEIEISPRDRFGDVLGSSVEMRRIYAILERLAPTDATVLVQGETGCGKELVARAIHQASRRAAGPFVAVDCGAIAETLIESELFGHVRGAFSGASTDRKGLFEEAHGGTVFLDEIGELPLALQPKLLRVLEAREVRPVGANAPRKVDVRVVAATHRSLAGRVNDGTFREDLYYRLAVFEVHIPPLRARREDIAVLARHFHARFTGRDEPLPADLLAAMMARSWPGNVRELRNFIERTVSLGYVAQTRAPEAPVGLEALVPAELPLKEARDTWTARFERLYVSALLRRTHGNVTRAAELAGVNRRSLQRLMAEHGIRSASPSDDD